MAFTPEAFFPMVPEGGLFGTSTTQKMELGASFV